MRWSETQSRELVPEEESTRFRSDLHKKKDFPCDAALSEWFHTGMNTFILGSFSNLAYIACEEGGGNQIQEKCACVV